MPKNLDTGPELVPVKVALSRVTVGDDLRIGEAMLALSCKTIERRAIGTIMFNQRDSGWR